MQRHPGSMRKKFLTNLILLVFLNLLVKPFWIFGIDRTVQNTVGTIDYGFYWVVFNFAFLFSILLDAGITNFNNRNIAQNQHLLNKHFSRIVILKFLLGIIYVAVIFAVALIIGYRGDQLKLLAWVGLNQLLLSFILYLRSNISGLLMFRTDSLMSVIDKLLMIAICAALLWGGITSQPFRIEWFVYAQTVSYFVTLLIALGVVMKKAKFRKVTWNLPFILVILRQSFPFALLVLLMTVYNRVDAVFLERLLRGDLGEYQSGLYAQSFRILDAANQFAWLSAVLLLPIYSRLLKEKRPVEEMVRLPFSILVTFAVILAAGALFYSREIIGWLYSADSSVAAGVYGDWLKESSLIFTLLMFSFLGTCTMYVFSTLLTANGELRWLNIIAAAGILVNFSLNLILIPGLMAWGSAIASLSTQILTSALQVVIVQKIFRFRINYRFLITLLVYTGTVFGLGLISRRLPLPWLGSFLIFFAASLSFAVAYRLLGIRAIIEIIKEKSDK